MNEAAGSGDGLQIGTAPENNLAAQSFSPGKVAANLRTPVVDRAEPRLGIEGHAGAIALLVQAAHPGVLDHQLLRDIVVRPQLHQQVAALATAGTGRDVVGEMRRTQAISKAQIPAGGEGSFRESQR